MEANLENLIDKIKAEGIEEAEVKAEKKLEEAEQEAQEIIDEAEDEATAIVEKAKNEAEQIKKSGEEALKQAQRDTILVTREKITDLLDKVFKNQIKEALELDFLQKIILELVQQLEAEEIELTLSKSDKQELAQKLFKEVREDLNAEEISLQAERGIDAGFKIKVEDEDVYYDLTDEGIANFLNEFLNPAIREILEDSN